MSNKTLENLKVVFNYFIDSYAGANQISHDEAKSILREYGMFDYLSEHYPVLGHAKPEQVASQIGRIVDKRKKLRSEYQEAYA
jgi:hypothetical protein